MHLEFRWEEIMFPILQIRAVSTEKHVSRLLMILLS